MSDLDQVLRLWQQIEAGAEDCVLATVVRVEGSSYRKPGARMLISKSGLRAGTISGGCLEAEVSRQAWWLTERGPVVRAYSTSFESDGDRPYGLGCGGTVHLLLERRAHAESFLNQLQEAFAARLPMACAVILEGELIGKRFVLAARGNAVRLEDAVQDDRLSSLAQEAWMHCVSFGDGENAWAEYIPPRTGLFIFGAGDDAKPLVTQAKTLGWHVTVADGRAHLATRMRFPGADDCQVLKTGSLQPLALLESDAAVVMTHSYQQDLQILKGLLSQEVAYLGVLGPRYRTADLLEDVARRLDGAGPSCQKDAMQAWQDTVHAPVGLDLGGESPAMIALSILAEIQQTLARRPTRLLAENRVEDSRQAVRSSKMP